jgi:hypothetical protein
MSDPNKVNAPAAASPTARVTGLTYVAVASTVLRVLHEAPALVDAIAKFWDHVSGPDSPPDHIDAAVQAAIATVKASTDPSP